MRKHAPFLSFTSWSFFSLSFFLILLAGFILSAITPDKLYSSNENRMLTQFPEVSTSSLVNGNFSDEFESFASDQFFQRDFWIMCKTRMDLELFLMNCVDDVYIGRDGYLLNRYASDSVDLELVNKNISYLKSFSTLYEADILLIPSASEILLSKLPSFTDHVDQQALLKDIETCIPVYRILQKHTDEDIFYRTDHHWTLLGAYYVYEELVASPVSYQPEIVSESFLGTIQKKINLPSDFDTIKALKSNSKFEVTYDGLLRVSSLYNEDALLGSDQYTYYLDGNHALTEISNYSIKNNNSVLLIKDSFANTFATLLCENYRKTVLIDLRYYNASLKEYIASNKFDDIVFLYSNIGFMQDNHLYKLLR